MAKKLKNLAPADYLHTRDIEAMNTLQAIPGLVAISKKANSLGLDRMIRMQSMANSIRVGPRQFKSLYTLFQDVCETLDVSGIDLFVQQDFSLNAFARGVEAPQVTVTTELINRLTPDELRFVIGHEVGHVKSEHVLYHQIGFYLPVIMRTIGQATLGLGSLVGSGFQMALYDWIRKSELTADRAGLLAVQAPDVVRSTFYKLAGVPASLEHELSMDEISIQSQEFEDFSGEDLNKFYRFLCQAWSTHPWIVIRISEMEQWINLGGYDRIMKRYGDRGNINSHSCPACGQPLSPASKFCVCCGYRVSYSQAK